MTRNINFLNPQEIQEIVQMSESKEYQIKLSVSEDTLPGRYLVTAVFTWDDQTFTREYFVTVFEETIVTKLANILLIAFVTSSLVIVIVMVWRKDIRSISSINSKLQKNC